MPEPVDKYFDEVKRDNPSYSDEQAWATAWSIYCKYKNPGSDSCSKPPSEYLTGKSASRVVGRYIEKVGTEFDSPEALKNYLKEHPQADRSKHTVKKPGKGAPEKSEGKEKEHGDKDEKEHGDGEEKPKKSWKERLKGLSDAASKFVTGAPKAVKQFIEDDAFRRTALMGAHKALTEAPEKLYKHVLDTVKEEVHEFKAAGQGIAAVLKGGKMTKHQKAALKTVSFHLAIGITAAALTATGPMAGVTMFAKGLARHIAAKSVSNAMGHLHVLDELGHIGHGVKHILEHVASDAQKGGNPEAVLARYIMAAKKGEDLDPEKVMADFITACVAKELSKLSDDDVKDALNGMGKDDEEEKKGDKEKKASLVVARFLAV